MSVSTSLFISGKKNLLVLASSYWKHKAALPTFSDVIILAATEEQMEDTPNMLMSPSPLPVNGDK